MSKMNQKAAVYSAIVNVLASKEIHFEDGMNVKEVMTKELRADVRSILRAGFNEGKIELDREPYATDAEWNSYISGLISNWIAKDKRFNGNVKHEAKAPGSRAGHGDAQVKALRGLLATVTTDAERKEIQGYLDSRLAELNAAKPKQVTVNLADLPAELQAKYSK